MSGQRMRKAKAPQKIRRVTRERKDGSRTAPHFIVLRWLRSVGKRTLTPTENLVARAIAESLGQPHKDGAWCWVGPDELSERTSGLHPETIKSTFKSLHGRRGPFQQGSRNNKNGALKVRGHVGRGYTLAFRLKDSILNDPRWQDESDRAALTPPYSYKTDRAALLRRKGSPTDSIGQPYTEIAQPYGTNRAASDTGCDHNWRGHDGLEDPLEGPLEDPARRPAEKIPTEDVFLHLIGDGGSGRKNLVVPNGTTEGVAEEHERRQIEASPSTESYSAHDPSSSDDNSAGMDAQDSTPLPQVSASVVERVLKILSDDPRQHGIPTASAVNNMIRSRIDPEDWHRVPDVLTDTLATMNDFVAPRTFDTFLALWEERLDAYEAKVARIVGVEASCA